MAFNATGQSANFSIQDAPSIVLDSPNSGSFAHNQSISIQWTKTNFTDNVDLYYTTSTTFSTSNVIATNFNSHPYSWNVPSSIAGSSIYIWVRKTGDSNVKDRSNSAISITNITLFRTIAESLTSSDTWSKTVNEYIEEVNIAESLTSSDTWEKTTGEWIWFRTIAESLTSSDTWSKTDRLWIKFKTFTESVTSSDTWSKADRLWIKFKTFTDSFTASDTWSKASRIWIKFKTMVESLAVSDTTTTTPRLWIISKTFADTLGADDISSVGHIVDNVEILTISDTVTSSIQTKGTVYELDGGGTDESFKALYKTGWITPQALSKNPIIRRLNMDYKSDSVLTIQVFANDDLTNPLTTKSLSASSSTTHGSIRLGTRVKYFLISIETTQSANENVHIERIEIEVDD